jgi:hypothetical protein
LKISYFKNCNDCPLSREPLILALRFAAVRR